jgi:hypothetical protein
MSVDSTALRAELVDAGALTPRSQRRPSTRAVGAGVLRLDDVGREAAERHRRERVEVFDEHRVNGRVYILGHDGQLRRRRVRKGFSR